MKIKNCAVIISGGGSGMGAATARLLSAAGAKVTIFDINEDAANKVANEINGLAIRCDITDEHSVASSVKEAQLAHGTARVAINCAGILQSKRMFNQQGLLSAEEFTRVLQINLIGTFLLMRTVAAIMTTAEPLGDSGERGVIINTASIAAFEGQMGQIAYCASKGGVVSMTLPAARELAQFGIRVMTIAPGLIDTPMFANLSSSVRTTLANSVPFPKRLGHPEEYARLVLHIIENEMLNGEVIRLDGALRMQPK